MDDVDDTDRRWDELTDGLSGLTSKLRDTYRTVADEDGPTEDEIRDALRTLAGAWGQVSESVAVALRDPAVKDHLKRAAESLAVAVSAGLSELHTAADPDETTDGGPG